MQTFETEPTLTRDPSRAESRENESGETLVADALDDINRTRIRIGEELGAPADSAEVTQATDEALVYVAEQTLSSSDTTPGQRKDAVDDVAVETALEIDGGMAAANTPVAEFEFKGYGDSIDDVVRRLHESHATLPSGHEAAPLVMRAVDELAGRSEGLIDRQGPGGGLEYVPVPPSGEVMSHDLMATVGEFVAIDETTAATANRMITNNPENYRQAVAVVRDGFGSTAETGYDTRLLATATMDVFGQYAQNGLAPGEKPADYYARSLEERYDAIGTFGSGTADLQKSINGENAGHDHVLNALMARRRSGEEIDAAAVRERLSAARDRFDALKADDPRVAASIAKHLGGNGDLGSIETSIDLGMAVAPVLAELGASSSLGEDRVSDIIFSGIGRRMTREQAATVIGQIGMFRELHAAHPGLEGAELASALLLKRHSAENLSILSAALHNPAVKDALEDPALTKDIGRSIGLVLDRGDRTDMPKDVAVARMVGEKGYLPGLMSVESKLSPPQRETFFANAQTVLTHRDKDGFLYDSPQALAQAVQESAQIRGGAAELAWFTSGSLPVSAFASVDRFRTDAVQAGVADTPRAVYEWIHGDPQKLAELSHDRTDAYVGRLLGDEGLDEGQRQRLVQEAAGLAEKISDDFRLFVNIDPEALGAVETNGSVIKSTFDLGGGRQDGQDRSSYDRDYMFRRGGTEVALGIRSLDDKAHPVYGSCGFVGDGIPEGASGYGSVMLSFKLDASLDARTTYSPEDSFHGADRLTRRDAETVRILKSAQGIGHDKTSDYVEAQISGGLDISTVEAVYVTSEEVIGTLPAALREKAVVRPVVDGLSPYRGRRERAMMAEFKRQETVTISAETPVTPAVTGTAMNAPFFTDDSMESFGSF